MERKFMKLIVFLLFLAGLVGFINAQKVPDGYFRSPLNMPLFLSGNFAELRTNHFHSGVDFKVGGKEGAGVYAVADGYVSRIRISPWGFGKALYIDHPNGYTSVYAHLRNFNDSLDKYSNNLQYLNQSFAIDTILKPGIFVRKGQLIGYAGNSGYSFGAHLHFEIRQTDTEKPQNPELFGFKIKDNTKPKAFELYVYPIKNFSRVNNKKYTGKFKLYGSNGLYNVGSQIITVSGLIGLGIDANDFYDEVSNKCGIYKLSLYEDGKKIYSYKLDEFEFSDSRYLNSHIDYEMNTKDKKKINKLFIEPGNKLNIYDRDLGTGLISVDDNKTKEIKIILEDISGNKTSVSFELKAEKSKEKYEVPESDFIIPFDSAYIIEKENFRLTIPSNSLYDTLFMKFSTEAKAGYYSLVYNIHDLYTPIHKSIELAIKPDSFIVDKEKMLMVRFNSKGGILSLGGEFLGDYIIANSSTLGSFAVYYDTVPPVIKPLNIFEGAKFVNDKKIEFKITDNLSGIQSYNGYIDEKWVKFEYDPRIAKIIYNFDEKIVKNGKKKQLKLIVSDERNNTAKYEVSFYY
ncbi:MAG: M23 family metallopeptidase [Bacteroidales bacterium]|nr:M23 family metallopeptidase [Bacteroidales bacterium]